MHSNTGVCEGLEVDAAVEPVDVREGKRRDRRSTWLRLVLGATIAVWLAVSIAYAATVRVEPLFTIEFGEHSAPVH